MIFAAWLTAKPLDVLVLCTLVLLLAHGDAVGVVPLSTALVLATDPEHLLCEAVDNVVRIAIGADVVVVSLEIDHLVQLSSRHWVNQNA